MLCMSAMTMTAGAATELHRDLRSRWGCAAFTSICGGPHPTGDPESVLRGGTASTLRAGPAGD
ncbi:MAG: hypothetical protein PVH52_02495, partial [bacterium]